MAKGATHEKRVRQNKHSEVVTVAAINAATTNLPGLAIKSSEQILREDFHKVVPEAQRSAEDTVYDNWHCVIIDVLGPRDFIKDMSAGVPADGIFATAMVRRNHKGSARGRDA